jgi:glycerophosphoryl diester phosphodiesterase
MESRLRRALVLAPTLCLLAPALTLVAPPAGRALPTLTGERPIVIGHRGASGYRPEHTLAAYALAIDQGADFIEPDLVATKDGVLVARHENELSSTTDVASRPEFAALRTTKTIDGVAVQGWFSEDFTLAELKSLRAIERIPGIRPANAAYDGQFEVPTFDEILALVAQKELETGRRIGLYPETKHPTYFDSIGLSLEEPMLASLAAHGRSGADALVFIQSFETANLKELALVTELPLVQLFGAGRPYDFVVAGDPRTYADLRTAAGLAEIAGYAAGVGPEKNQLVVRDGSGAIAGSSGLVEDAHAAGLLVHPYTFRAEPIFHFLDFPDDPVAEIGVYLALGIDGFFTDNPDLGVAAVAAIPEPASATLVAVGLATAAALRRPLAPSRARRSA